MEFSNKLSLSMQQDIKALNKVASSILQKVSSFELNSWLFPTKSFKEATESPLSQRLLDNKYPSYLEIIIDRLYLIINLSVKYIEIYITPLQKGQLPRNVVKSPNISLGGSVELLWKKLEDLSELVKTRQLFYKEKINNQQSTSSTQTPMCSSKTCSSCDVAMTCIKDVVKSLGTCGCNLYVEKMRKDLREDIFDLTQWGCMNRITTAITQDVKVVVENWRKLEELSRKCNEKLQDLTIKYGESLKIAHNLEKSLKKSRKCSRNARLRNKNLLKKVDELLSINQTDEVKIRERDRVVETLQVSLQESRVSLALLSTNNEKLNKDVEQALSQTVKISDEKNLWKRRFSDVYLENRKLKVKMEDLNAEIIPLRDTFSMLGCKSEKLSVLLEKLNIDITKRAKGFEAFLTQLKKQRYSNEEAIKDSNMRKDHEEFTAKVTGDPLVDMKRQIAINRLNITNLEEQNNSLLRIIQRVEKTILPIRSS